MLILKKLLKLKMWKKILLILLLVQLYFFWYRETHAGFSFVIYWSSTNHEINISKGKVFFLDENKKTLATGTLYKSSSVRYQVSVLSHPKYGDCKNILRNKGKKLKIRQMTKCNDYITTWIPKWASKIKFITIQYENCLIKEKSLSNSRITNDGVFLLYYIYYPRGGVAMPTTHYSYSLNVSVEDCSHTATTPR